MIARSIQNTIEQFIFCNKIIIIYGARQVGKTTLSKFIAVKNAENDYKYIDCDIIQNRQALEVQDPEQLKRFIGSYKIVIIDEAQRVENIGLILKLLHTYLPQIQFIATGSSSFELSHKINEPLTGRSMEFLVTPFAGNELKNKKEYTLSHNHIEQLLMYGSYPETINHPDNAIRYLKNLASNYLYKDILALESLKKSDQLLQLLQLLAWQIGNEVSYNELGQKLGLSVQTIQKYISLLEKSFIIFRLPSYKKNLRNEIGKSQKIYFRDLGVRNALIDQFIPITFRNDIGALRENFALIERQKYLHNTGNIVSSYFWRNHQGAEIDYIEINPQGEYFLYKYKRNGNKKVHIPKAFTDNYGQHNIKIISPKNIDTVRI
ncbi:MAG TPA: ATP-binding protein [Candidatus Absconditabacterales bacterium]|nr:ATP-binding protein [Candidatus Absconditabacterales bacterium]